MPLTPLTDLVVVAAEHGKIPTRTDDRRAGWSMGVAHTVTDLVVVAAEHGKIFARTDDRRAGWSMGVAHTNRHMDDNTSGTASPPRR
jgi:hypothetical protein